MKGIGFSKNSKNLAYMSTEITIRKQGMRLKNNLYEERSLL